MLRFLLLFSGDLALVREQHSKSKKTDDQSAGDANARDRNAKRNHYKVSQEKKCDQDTCHVDTGPQDLSVSLLWGEMRADAKKKERRAHRIDDGDKCNKRNAHPGEILADVFQYGPFSTFNRVRSFN